MDGHLIGILKNKKLWMKACWQESNSFLSNCKYMERKTALFYLFGVYCAEYKNWKCDQWQVQKEWILKSNYIRTYDLRIYISTYISLHIYIYIQIKNTCKISAKRKRDGQKLNPRAQGEQQISFNHSRK